MSIECPIKDGCKFLDEWYCPFKVTFNCRDDCPYAPILKLLAEAKEVVEVGKNFRNTDGVKEEGMWFWIRR